MKRRIIQTLGVCGLVFGAAFGLAQEDRGDWSLTGGDPGQSGWQKAESKLSRQTAAANVKFLWKIQLGEPSKGEPSKGEPSFSEPLLASRLINAQGFKDMVYWGSADTLYAVDSELGVLLWHKEFKSETSGRDADCGATRLSILMEPPQVINFNARRRRPPGTPPPPQPPPSQPSERRLGVAPGGGYFGLKGIYALTSDGMLHEQVITTGADFAPPVRLLPAPNADSYSLNYLNHAIYSAVGRACSGVANGLWSIDLTSPDYLVKSLNTGKVKPLNLSGPVLTPDGISLVVTGPEESAADSAAPANSVVAISREMKAENWYTPSGGMGSYQAVSPITFTYKEKQLVVAPGKDGSVALLDAALLGGVDHHTALSETSVLAKPRAKHGWDGFAAYQDKDGTAWVFASISTGITLNESDVKLNGSAAHGGIVALKLEENSGQLALKPVWVSEDMVNPSPPRIANGVIVALSGGDTSTHATLLMLDAATGAERYSSKNEIPTYTGLSGVAVGDSHAFFTDHNNVLYSFGIGMEH